MYPYQPGSHHPLEGSLAEYAKYAEEWEEMSETPQLLPDDNDGWWDEDDYDLWDEDADDAEWLADY